MKLRPLPSRSYVLAIAVTCVLVNAGLACDNPDLHPGSEEYVALQKSLGGQPRPPVQMMFKTSDMRFRGWPITISLSFWPFGEYSDATVLVTPSAGLRMINTEGAAAAADEVPYKGTLEYIVRPDSEGFHYLRIDLSYRVDDTTSTYTTLVPVAVGGHDEKHTQSSSGAGYGFAGPKLIERLQKNSSAP